MKTRRLTKQEWQEIEQLIRNKNKSITQISTFYGVSRHSIYAMAWKKGWIKKKRKGNIFISTINFFIKKIYGIKVK
jgi:hypothetical protein